MSSAANSSVSVPSPSLSSSSSEHYHNESHNRQRIRMRLIVQAARAMIDCVEKEFSRTGRFVNIDLSTPLRLNVTFDSVTSIYSDHQFRIAFRMSKHNFNKLYEVLANDLDRNHEMGRRSRRLTIPGRVRLAVGLRMLSGASYLDLMGMYRISSTSVYRIFKEVRESVLSTLQFPGLPDNEDGLRALADGFTWSRKTPNVLYGCVGALDGICIRIRKPRESENPAAYYCRKEYYAIPVQACVDSDYRVMDFSALAVGSTNDALAFAISPLARFLEDDGLPFGFFISADNAYPQSNSIMTPFGGTSRCAHKEAFDWLLSSMRMHVEQAFGIIVRRWRILYVSELNYSLRECTKVIAVAFLLHNYCIDNGEEWYYDHSAEEIAMVNNEADNWYKEMKEVYTSLVPSGSPVENQHDLREKLLSVVREKGILRPTPRQ